MSVSHPVLVLLRLLHDGAMRRDAAREFIGGGPGVFESTLAEAGALVKPSQGTYRRDESAWFLNLTPDGERALAAAQPG